MVETSRKYAHFRETQEAIYQRFRNAMATLGETATNPVVITPQGGFLIALRHPSEVTEKAAAISERIALHAPAITYGTDTLHTTVSDHALSSGLEIDPTDKVHKATLDQLCKIVAAGLAGIDYRTLQKRHIHFSSPLANETTVIAPGYGNDALLDINEAIRSASIQAGINDGEGLRGAWGSHMTLNRFTQSLRPGQGQAVANSLLTTPPLGNAVPTAIDVGHLQVSADGFSFNTYERFDFKNVTSAK